MNYNISLAEIEMKKISILFLAAAWIMALLTWGNIYTAILLILASLFYMVQIGHADNERR